MGSNEQSDPIDGTVLVSEAPKEPADRSSEECGSLVPLVSVSSTKAEIDSNVFSSPIHKTTSASEALKEEEESFCTDECGSLVLEHPALMSGLGPIDQCKETVDESVYEQQFCMETSESLGCDGDFISFMDGSTRTIQDSVVDMCCEAETGCKDVAAVLGAVESNTKDKCCPESNILSEVECGISRISLNKINLKNERMLHYLNPVASSLEYVHFSGYDCSSNILGESQMASLKRSVLSGSGIVEEGSLPSLHSNNLSFQRNLKSVMDLSDAVNGLLVDIPLSPSNGVPNSSTKCLERKNSDHIDVPLPGINSESSDLEHEVLSGQRVSSYLIERYIMQSPVKQLDSLQSCVPDIVLGSGSSSDPSRQEAFKLNGIIEGNNCIIEGNNSVAVADASCFADEGQGDIRTGVRLMESNEASLRRSSRANKFIHKASNRNYTSKGSTKASSRTIDLLPAAVRRRRSCLNRSARVSDWGLIDTLSKYIELNTRVDQGSGSVKSGKKNRKKDKIQEGAGSRGSYAKNCVSSGHIQLKLKLVNKSKSIIAPNPLVRTDTQVVHFRNGDKQLDLSNGEGSQKSLECSSSIMMDKSATSHENPGVAVHSVHTDLGVTLMSDKCSRNDIGGRSSSDKEVEKSGVSTDDRHLNSGTSPDSEVIQVPDSQFPSEVLEVHLDGEMDSSKAIPTSAQNAIPRRKKGNKKEKLCQLVNSDVQNSLLSSSIIYKTEMVGKFCDNGPKSDVATSFDVGHELADSRISKKLLPPAKAEGNRKSKSKLKPNGAPRLDMNKSRGVKGDKWKLEGKYSVCENGISNQAHKKDDNPEVAGKHTMDDSGNMTNNTTSGGTSNDVSGLSVIPGGIVQQIAQPRSAWVCCDDCLKWRCIPSNLADIIDDTNCRWTCKDNQDKAFAECSIPQEKSNAEINAELNISDAEEGHDVQLSGPQQSSWMLIKSNIYLHRSRKTQTLDEIMVCHCKSTRDGKLGCGDECLNRMLNIECVQGTCPCGDLCANQQFQRQSYANLKWFRCGKKGYGLQVIDDVTQGQFLIEYVGEVLELPTYEERVRVYASKGHKHFYFMTLNGNEVIDACAKGNLGRFINHSCDPNCRTEKWMVNGEICIGIFAIRDIKKGEELTFDYNYVRVFGAAAKKCHCGSAQCRGYIGGDRLNNEAIVQGDSDEEFPEPVAVYENGEIAEEYNIMSKSDSANVLEEKNEDILLHNDLGVTLEDKDVMNKLEFSQKDGMHESVVGYSQTNSYGEVVGYMQAENVDKTTLDVEQEKPMSRINICSVSPKRSDSLSLNRLHPESLSESVDTRSNRSLIKMGGGETVASKARPRMKKSRPSKPVKSKESSDSSATIDKPLVTSSKSQVTPNKLKKLVENSAKHRLETVEDKLNELLDNVGGICKRKDAFKGYLKLLVLTAASGDCSHHETIQSNKDLSMILDAILKTKSRTVLTDILNKNGLQMLHSLMKKCRGNFTKIPILRKLLKVFECLAERKILTLEHINAEPPRPGMERFRDSILTLTEYEDRKVHQIARNFRDRWIPRPSKKFNCLEKGDRIMDFNGAPNCSRLLGSHHQRFDHVERDSESMDCVKQSLPSNHLIDSDALEGSPRCSVKRIRKRKSGWDQLPDAVCPHCIKEQKTEAGSSLKFDSDLQPWKRGEMTFDDHLKTSQEIQFCNEDDERRITDEDAPPGFSLPSSFGSPHPSTGTSTTGISFSQQYPGPLKCPPEMPLGYPQEIYNSEMPMAYAIPFNTVQEFGTPAASTGDGWVIAPGMPFRPFPPLPPYPHQRLNKEVPPSAFSGVGSAGKSQDCYLTDTRMDQGCPSSSSARLPNMIPNGNTYSQQDRGPYRHERRYFKQRQKNFRKPPWGLDGKGSGCRQNYSTIPAGVALGTMVNDHSEHPENVNYGVEFAGNSC